MGDAARLFNDMASYGYVVAAPTSCQYGCLDDCKSEPSDPPCWGTWYKEQLKMIDWAQTQATTLPINASAGVGIAGHSMGGQATLFSAAYNGSDPRIKAAVMH